MPTTVPNQRTICVHREKASADFLGIKNRNWMAASRDLGAHALMLYLYLASNANGYTLALSPAAIRQAIAMPSSTYRDQFLKLVDKGYLVQRGKGNTYDFYEVPQRVTRAENESAADGFDFADIEINKNNTNSIINRGVEKQVSPAPKNEFIF